MELGDVGDFTELLLSAGYERDDQSLGAIAAAERPSTGDVETFCDEMAELFPNLTEGCS